MARNIEPTLNTKLGELLVARHPRWTNENVHAQRTGVLLDYPQRQIDVLVENPFGQPVAIEAEFTASPQVGREAESRLGLKTNSGEIIESAISVVYPQSLRVGSPSHLESATLKFATHHLESRQSKRWPLEGQWLAGTVDDLADTVEAVSLSQRLLEFGTKTLQEAIATATKKLRSDVPKSVLKNVASELCQQDEEQTTRMATAILTGAFVFHYAIEGHSRIPMVGPNGGYTKTKISNAWRSILEVNYEPIFKIAEKILRHIPAIPARSLLTTIAQAAEELAAIGATTFHDLAGKAFQALIADRKFLATYYTRPESACLLAELAVDRLPINWADANAIKKLRVADFACGTGALLSAAQRSIYRRHRRTGADDATIHSAAMRQVFTGTDIMPAAAHLTASMLSSIHPEVEYKDSDIHALPYGRDPRWGISIGALDLAVENEMLSLFGTGEERLRGTAGASKDNASRHISVANDSYDLIIMNPPFVRPTGHEAKKKGIPVPSFAAFGTTGRDQRDMSRKLARIPRLFGHGNAGLASNFMDLAHVKLKEGGILAVVLPFTFATGEAWASARSKLSRHYSKITMVAITSSGARDRAFSADTDLAECLVIATKKSKRRSSITSFFNVRSRPETSLEATVVAKDIIKGTGVIKGSILDAGPAAVLHLSLVRTMENLKKNKLRILSYAKTFNLPMTSLGNIGNRGPYHMDISSNPPRGPFDLRLIGQNEIATYPILWGHDAERERKLIVQYDQCGDIRLGREDEADELWSSASRLHYNRDFGLSAQSIAACLTPDWCLGGRAWPSFKPHDPEHEFPLVLWANTTLGLLAFWWKGTLQQPGRASLPVTALPELLVLDVRKLSKKQLNLTKRIFSAFESRGFKPANEAYCDRVRIALDRAMLVDVMGLPEEILEPLKTLRNQWCAEPTVHGGKKTRISEDMLRPGIVSQDRELDDAFFAEIAVAWKSIRKPTRKRSRSRSSRRSDR